MHFSVCKVLNFSESTFAAFLFNRYRAEFPVELTDAEREVAHADLQRHDNQEGQQHNADARNFQH